MKCPAVILAGGRSSRIGGGDKCLLPLGQTSILARIIAVLSPQVDAICINSNSDLGLFVETGLPVLPDIMSGRLGPLAGILTAMCWAQRVGASKVVTVACDTPFLPDDLVSRLSMRSGDDITVASSGETIHPTIGLWPVRHAQKLKEDIDRGARGVRAWLATEPFDVVDYPTRPVDPFWNINTHADWELAQASVS